MICASCQKQYRHAETGVALIFLSGKMPVSIYFADLAECPGCGHRVVHNQGQLPRARIADPDFRDIIDQLTSGPLGQQGLVFYCQS